MLEKLEGYIGQVQAAREMDLSLSRIRELLASGRLDGLITPHATLVSVESLQREQARRAAKAKAKEQ